MGALFVCFWKLFEIHPLKRRCSTIPWQCRLGGLRHRDIRSLWEAGHCGTHIQTQLLRRHKIIVSHEPKFKATLGNVVRPPLQTKQSPTLDRLHAYPIIVITYKCVCVWIAQLYNITCIFSGIFDNQLMYSYLGETQEELVSYMKDLHN